MLGMGRYRLGKEYNRTQGDHYRANLTVMEKGCIRIVTGSIISESGRKDKWTVTANYIGTRKKFIIKANSKMVNSMGEALNTMAIHA